ncbi:replication endonuclease [Vibrio maritimus]|uniref:replication endonuclease n=1 Tax=Vibrio maritimus TaxID=990268 RepID=UPI001F289B94|nr:replication endonuclease [Vibrio maritimus]
MKNASTIRNSIKRTMRQKDLIPVRLLFDAPELLVTAMQEADKQGSLFTQELKDTARDYVHRHGTPFSRHFIPRLPFIVREDVEYQIAKRLKRKNATRSNMERFINTAVKHALKFAPVIEDKFPFVDERCVINEKQPLERTNQDSKPIHTNTFTSKMYESISFDHHALMCDNRIEAIARHLTARFTDIIHGIQPNEEDERGYADALIEAYRTISNEMEPFFIQPPTVNKKYKEIQDAERDLEIAIRRCLDATYLIRKFKYLRTQYIEYSQIALGRVGKKKGQVKYVSPRSMTRWKHKQRESEQWLEAMAAYDPETGITFALDEVVKRTVSNQENRRVELVVRTRGDEERAIDLDYEGVFITWTLPSKYHRNSVKWNGCTVKEAHQNLMHQWQLARAWFKKMDIDWFGLRVAEPHNDGTPHAHLFIYVHPNQKQALIDICRTIACDEDSDELSTTKAREARFLAKECDPEKGTATGYIIKYISKNINGAHMPETDAEFNAERVRAWASTHRIKQFSQSGAKPVGIWRQLRRATAKDTFFDEELEALRDAADNSRWSAFCEIAGHEKLAYEEKLNQFGETTKRVIGIEWLGKVIETASAKYSLVKKSDVKRLQEARRASPWSTENKCNQPPPDTVTPLEKALMDVTGWSIKGVQCLIGPLKRGSKIPIDKHTKLSIRSGRLCTT